MTEFTSKSRDRQVGVGIENDMRKGKIIRAPRSSESPYFATARATAQDRTISFEARGMLWYLLSKPDNWEVQPKDLEQQCSRGRVYRLLDELGKAGYLEYKQERVKGRWSSGFYLVHEVPCAKKAHAENDNTVGEPPCAKKPRAVNRHHTDKRVLQNTESTEKDSADTPMAVSGDETATPTLPPAESPTNEPKSPPELTPFKEVQTAIIDEWFAGDWSNAAWAGDLTHMFMGTATKKAYKNYNFDPPFDAPMVRLFAAWLRSQNVEFPTSPAKLLRWKGKFLSATGRAPKPNKPAANDSDPTPDAYLYADRSCPRCNGNGQMTGPGGKTIDCQCVKARLAVAS